LTLLLTQEYIEEIRAKFMKYRIRTCRYLNECNLCGADITAGQEYYDGGRGRRAHMGCVPPPYRWSGEGKANG